MLAPVPTPATSDAHAWERVLAFEVSAAMEPSDESPRGLTPAEAAGAGVAATRSRLPRGSQLPFDVAAPAGATTEVVSRDGEAVEEPLPGGIHAADGRHWIIVARVEDAERTMFDADELLTAEELGAMATAYDRHYRTAAVVLPGEGMSAHFVGEHSRWIPASVDALQFDGYHLWALLRSRWSDLEWSVVAGATQRSIQWWGSLPELPGAPPYLRHIALLTGEPPGIANMPSLDQWFAAPPPDLDVGTAGSHAYMRSAKELTTAERTYEDLPAQERRSPMATKQKTSGGGDATPKPGATPQAPDDKDTPRAAAVPAGTPEGDQERSDDAPALTEDRVTEIVGQSLARALPEALRAVLAPPETADDEPEGDPQLRALGEQIQALTAKVTAVETAQTEATRSARNSGIAAQLEDMVAQGRLLPAQRTQYLTLLSLADDATVNDILQGLRAMEPLSLLQRAVPHVQDPETGDNLSIPEALLPPREANLAPANALAQVAVGKALKATEGESDPEKQRAAFVSQLRAAAGHGAAATAGIFN